MNECLKVLLEIGKDDWVHVAEIAEVAIKCGETWEPRQVLANASSIVRHCLEEDLFVIGDVTETGFCEWQTDISESLRTFESEWPLDRLPRPGEVCWLKITEKGWDTSS